MAGLMIIIGYPGELLIAQDTLGTRWHYWQAAMVPFVFIVYTLLIGLRSATNAEPDEGIASLIRRAQIITVLSWCTYPVVYVFPMMGITGAGAVVAIQIGYCVSDIISKCGLGLLIYGITKARSDLEIAAKEGALLA